VEILPWHGSADLVALARANGLIRFGTEPNQFATGATVQVMCL
jgi:molybdopterin biosynthesis enzyme